MTDHGTKQQASSRRVEGEAELLWLFLRASMPATAFFLAGVEVLDHLGSSGPVLLMLALCAVACAASLSSWLLRGSPGLCYAFCVLHSVLICSACYLRYPGVIAKCESLEELLCLWVPIFSAAHLVLGLIGLVARGALSWTMEGRALRFP